MTRETAKELVLCKWINGMYSDHHDSKWIRTIWPSITRYTDLNFETLNVDYAKNRKVI